MSRVFRLFVLVCVVAFAVGCSGSFVAKERYEKDILTLQEFADQLQKRNQVLEAQLGGGSSINNDELMARQDALYDKIAKDLQEWLKNGNYGGDITFDPKTGRWTVAGDLLFASGSFKLTSRGQEAIRKIAQMYGSKSNHFKIVGHTDRDPIKKASTRQNLHFDSNLELSAIRAVSVASELGKSGIAINRMFVEGKGNSEPVAPNDHNAANKKKNRRVEIYILDGIPAK